jgi:hypothetical protein
MKKNRLKLWATPVTMPYRMASRCLLRPEAENVSQRFNAHVTGVAMHNEAKRLIASCLQKLKIKE